MQKLFKLLAIALLLSGCDQEDDGKAMQDPGALFACSDTISIDKRLVDASQEVLASGYDVQRMSREDGAATVQIADPFWEKSNEDLQKRLLTVLGNWSRCSGGSGVVLIYREGDNVPDGTFSLANGLRWGRD